MDLFILEIFARNKNHVGYYAAALTISALIWLAPSHLYQSIKPKISNLITSSEGMTELQSLLDSVNKVVICMSGISAFIIIFFSQSLLSLFGQDYLYAQVALTLLAIGSFFGGCMGFASAILVYTGHEGMQLKVVIFELISLCLLGPPASHFFGILGLAVVSSSVMVCGGLFSVFVVRMKLKIRSALFV